MCGFVWVWAKRPTWWVQTIALDTWCWTIRISTRLAFGVSLYVWIYYCLSCLRLMHIVGINDVLVALNCLSRFTITLSWIIVLVLQIWISLDCGRISIHTLDSVSSSLLSSKTSHLWCLSWFFISLCKSMLWHCLM